MSFGRYYCIECLRKFRRKQLPSDGMCPFCKVALRGNKTRIIAQIVTRLKRHRGVIPPKQKDDYELYLASDLWKTIRERVWVRDGLACRVCNSRAEVVHHTSYDRDVLDGNRDEALVSLCHDCHSAIEFNFVDRRKVKNGLKKANSKLTAMLATSGQP